MSMDLSTIVSTAGVNAAAIFDSAGECIASELPPPYEPILLADAMDKLNGAYDFFTAMGDDAAMSALSVRCDDGYLLLRKVGDLTTLVLAETKVNVAMLNVALNVLALNMSRRSKAPSAVGDSQRLSAPPLQGSMWSSPSATSPPPPDAVGKAPIRDLLHMLQRLVGPAAKLVLKQELTKLGVSARTLRQGQWADLIDALGRRIADADKRRAFAEAAKQLVG